MRATLLVLMLLLTVPLVYSATFGQATPWLSEGAVYIPENLTLNDYPNFLFSIAPPEAVFNAKIVKGSKRKGYEISSVNYLLNRLPLDFILRYEDRYGRLRAARVNSFDLGRKVLLDEEVEDEPLLVVVGMPCHNSLIPEVLGMECEAIVNPGEGLVKLVSKEGKTYLIITASDGKMLFDTVRRFHTARKGSLPGRELRIRKGYGALAIGHPQDILTIGETIGSVVPALSYRPQVDPRLYYLSRRTVRPRYRSYTGYRTYSRPSPYQGYFTGQRVVISP